MNELRSIELFAGAGGLALGVSSAGFTHDAVVEWNDDACATIRANKERRIKPVMDWPLFNMDVRHFDYSTIREEPDLLAGGPPCQPFSIGGKHRGQHDERNMFPEMLRAIRRLKPRAVLVENVRGLIRESFIRYFEYIVLQITYPEIEIKEKETWQDHLTTLEKQHTKGKYHGLTYRPVYQCLNAANYGVPQRRERVFIVAFRSDQNFEWSFPEPTHSHDALLWDQWISGAYWERHGITRKNRPQPPTNLQPKILALENSMIPFQEQPCLTVRDVIGGLPTPTTNKATAILNHYPIEGARVYKGHTGSPLDEPAKTLKAGDHGVPGGENMLLNPDGSVRYFTVRESARLQTFPDNIFIAGSWTESMRQLGNAVPVTLASTMASSIARKLKGQ